MKPQNNTQPDSTQPNADPHATDIATDDARQGKRVGLIWILVAGTLIAVVGLAIAGAVSGG